MKFPLGEMTVGDILDRGLKLLLARLPVFYAINLLVLTPVILVQIAAPFLTDGAPAMDPATAMTTMGVGMFALFLALVLQPLGTAAVLQIIMEEYIGNRVTMGQALAYAMTRFLPLIGASLLVGLIVFAGLLLCCIPGIYFAISYIFISQVVVLERLGPGEALQRCWKLIEGHRGRVFGVLLLVGIANMIVQVALGAVFQFVLPAEELIPTEDGFETKLNPVNHIVGTLVAQLASILFSTYTAVCTTLLYLDLRIRKEGFDLEMAAREEEPSDGEYGRRDRDRDDEDWDEDRYEDYDRGEKS
jgi:hypothetical protein